MFSFLRLRSDTRFGHWDESGLLIHAPQTCDASRASASFVMSEITSWDLVAARNMGDSRAVSEAGSDEGGPGRR